MKPVVSVEEKNAKKVKAVEVRNMYNAQHMYDNIHYHFDGTDTQPLCTCVFFDRPRANTGTSSSRKVCSSSHKHARTHTHTHTHREL